MTSKYAARGRVRAPHEQQCERSETRTSPEEPGCIPMAFSTTHKEHALNALSRTVVTEYRLDVIEQGMSRVSN